jgi:GT2 family glycosyltransferase
MNRDEVAIIIVNWNGREYLENCLKSLRNQTFKNFRIILVDNGSTDDSVKYVGDNFLDVQIIKFETNTGFAYANNVGIKEAFKDQSIKHIITLNNDTDTDSEYVGAMVRCAENHPEAGSIQPKVINFYDKYIIDSVGILIYPDMNAINRGQKEKDQGQYEREEEIFGASASAALYAREALEKTVLPGENYFDSDYFAYYEDVDLAWRLRLSGYKSYYCPKAIVYHIHSATGKNYSPFKSFHIHRNQYYNIIKDLPLVFLIKALAMMPIRYFLLVSSIIRKKGPAAKLSQNEQKQSVTGIVFRSWKEAAKNLLQLLKKRKYIQKKRVVRNSEINEWFQRYRADWRKMIYGE